MLHLYILCINCKDSKLGPMDTSCDTYIYNHTYNAENIVPAYLFTGTLFPHHKLKNLHVWVCPVYVLYPMLQKVRNLPKWQTWSCCGVFFGFNSNYSSNVSLVLNSATCHISPQIHVIFDDYFSTVLYLSYEG